MREAHLLGVTHLLVSAAAYVVGYAFG